MAAMRRLFLSAAWTLPSDSARSYHFRLKPAHSVTVRLVPLKLKHDDDEDRQEQEEVDQPGLEPEADFDQAAEAIAQPDPWAGKHRPVEGRGAGAHSTLTSRVRRPRLVAQR